MAGILEQFSKGLFGLAPVPQPNSTLASLLDSGAEWGRGVQNRYGALASPQVWAAALSKPPQQLGLLSTLLNPDVPQEQKRQVVNNGIDTVLNAGGLMGLGIVKPQIAKQLSTERNLPKSPEFSEAVANTGGARITEDGLLMNVSRNQRPEQSLTDSVRGGVFYLPDGAAQAKHYSTGKNGYGGSEKIAGETQFNNPIFVKGATGGKAPESAYDQLIGKGAYQNMRNDALRVRHPDLISQREGTLDSLKGAITPEQFLEKYAPELKGMGDYIFRNSRQGNQLAYALQEAAVGSAVRNAGHDAVLGYSQGRNGNGKFISEIFDVREKSYPDKFGTETRIWDNFKK